MAAFKFNWDLDSADLIDDNDPTPPASVISQHQDATDHTVGLESSLADLQLQKQANTEPQGRNGCQKISLDQLIQHLPPALSYSAIEVPLTKSGKPTGSSAKILRRDLFDARFQLANEEDGSDDDGSAYGNAIPRNESPIQGVSFGGDTDLIKGVYEGGLKTWEGSLDLVDCLCEQGYSSEGKSIRGTRVLEVGCGTAVPTIYLLGLLFRQLLTEEAAGKQPEKDEETVVHLQDYNIEVLQYITFCNIVLAYWDAKTKTESESSTPTQQPDGMPKTKKKKREAIISGDTSYTTQQDAEEELDELEMTDELVDSLLDFLKRWNIRIECFAGGWSSFEVLESERYDIILTSETVYDLDNLPHLKDLLRRSSKQTKDQMTLVACKRIYFGVGGGEIAFKRAISDDAEVDNVWASSTGGVERTVMRVRWPQASSEA